MWTAVSMPGEICCVDECQVVGSRARIEPQFLTPSNRPLVRDHVVPMYVISCQSVGRLCINRWTKQYGFNCASAFRQLSHSWSYSFSYFFHVRVRNIWLQLAVARRNSAVYNQRCICSTVALENWTLPTCRTNFLSLDKKSLNCRGLEF